FVDKDEKKVIFNAGLSVGKDHRGLGLGTRIFSEQVSEAVKNGFDRIETDGGAARDENGYYTWPRLGYDRSMGVSDWPWSAPPPSFGSVNKISDLMKTPEGREWWKQH